MKALPNIVFAGTPGFALPCLSALVDAGFPIVGVYTQPDRPAGRGRVLTPSPIKVYAQSKNLPVFQPKNLRAPEATMELAQLRPDVMIVVAYGQILPQAVLDIPPMGCINVHASLLPRWRGAAPLQHALLAGDGQTGVSIMQMDAGLDTGPVYEMATLDIPSEATLQWLHDEMATLGANALLKVLSDIQAGQAVLTPQPDEGVTYAHKIEKKDGHIQWQQDAEHIMNQARALTPGPGVYGFYEQTMVKFASPHVLGENSDAPPGTLLGIEGDCLRVQTGSGIICFDKAQLPGAKMLPVSQLKHGAPDWFGQRVCLS